MNLGAFTADLIKVFSVPSPLAPVKAEEITTAYWKMCSTANDISLNSPIPATLLMPPMVGLLTAGFLAPSIVGFVPVSTAIYVGTVAMWLPTVFTIIPPIHLGFSVAILDKVITPPLPAMLPLLMAVFAVPTFDPISLAVAVALIMYLNTLLGVKTIITGLSLPIPVPVPLTIPSPIIF